MNLISVFFILISLLVICCILLYVFQERFIFIDDKKIEKDHKFNFSNKFDEVFIKTEAKAEINALHFRLPKPKGVILFCHGNKGNLAKWGDRVSYFLDYNYEVLVFDYRNYGKSTGSYNEEAMYNDGLSIYKYLKKGFKEENIIVYGYSLGGTFATRIAAENKPKELILEAPFYNFKSAVKYKYKRIPVFLIKYKFRTDLDIKKVTSPITIFHGTIDQTTSCKGSKKLLISNDSKNNNYLEINKGTHHNLREFKLYKQKLKEILER